MQLGAFAFPLSSSNNEILGVLVFFHHRMPEPHESLLEMFSSVGSQIAQFMKQKQSERSLRKLSRRLLRVREEERRRIARQLHDTTAQRLAVLKFNLFRLSNQGHHLTREAQKVAAESLTQVDKAIQEVRTLAYALHPPELHQFGLAAALEAYVKEFSHRSGIETELNLAREIDRLPP